VTTADTQPSEGSTEGKEKGTFQEKGGEGPTDLSKEEPAKACISLNIVVVHSNEPFFTSAGMS
jgi:hypothetical protein